MVAALKQMHFWISMEKEFPLFYRNMTFQITAANQNELESQKGESCETQGYLKRKMKCLCEKGISMCF